MSVDKQLVRARMRAVRAGIIDRDRRSRAIWLAVVARCEHLQSAGRYREPLVVLAFIGTGTEPDTSPLLTSLHGRGFAIALPRVEGDELMAVPWTHSTVMADGAFGIPAPVGDALDPTAIDVVIVPGLAFTRDGRRLGQGGGFYDRFLPQLRADCATIGVGFSEQLLDELPVEPHDRTLGAVITDDLPE